MVLSIKHILVRKVSTGRCDKGGGIVMYMNMAAGGPAPRQFSPRTTTTLDRFLREACGMGRGKECVVVSPSGETKKSMPTWCAITAPVESAYE